MPKKISIVIFMLLVVLGSVNVFASEYQYISYNTETGEEELITLTDAEVLLEVENLNEGVNNLTDDQSSTLKEMSSGTYLSTLSILDGKPLVRVTNLVAHYKKIVCLITDVGNTRYKGTGFMVAPNVMVTAAHNLEQVRKYNNLNLMKVHYLQNGATLTSQSVGIDDYMIPPEYDDVEDGDIRYDWCVVLLDESIGNQTTYFDYTVTPTSSSSVFVSGYPYNDVYYQYSSNGSLSCQDGYNFYHTCSTYEGHSGSPIFNGSGTVYGIHVAGGGTYNVGTRITLEVMAAIAAWD